MLQQQPIMLPELFTCQLYVLMYRFSQDHLELLFNSIRASGGWNNNLTAVQFKRCFKHIMFRCGVKPTETGNVTRQDSTVSLSLMSTDSSIPVNDISTSPFVESMSLVDHHYLPTRFGQLVENALVYIAGFVVKQVMPKLDCDTCRGRLVTRSVPESLHSGYHLLTIKNNGGLVVPSAGTDCTQSVKIGDRRSSTLTLSTGSPQGCVLSPLLYTIYTYDCSPIHPCNTIIKFADDTSLVGLITKDDDIAYRDEVYRLTEWCDRNNLTLNTRKTKEVIMDFSKYRTDPPPLCIKGNFVERVPTFKFLGTRISEDLSWAANTSAIVKKKKAQQCLHFLRVLRWNRLQTDLLVSFYRATIESILVQAIPVWYAGCTVANRRSLQRVIRTAEKVISCPLPTLDSIASSRCLTRARAIIKDHFHPNNHLFNMLPSGRRFRSIKGPLIYDFY